MLYHNVHLKMPVDDMLEEIIPCFLSRSKKYFVHTRHLTIVSRRLPSFGQVPRDMDHGDEDLEDTVWGSTSPE